MVLMIELRELNLIDAGTSRSEWCMAKLELTWLCDVRKLRVINSSTFLTMLVDDSFMEMHKLELLDLSGNSDLEVLPNLSAASGLKVLILDGCDGLQHVEPDAISTSLESFSFDGFGQASSWKNFSLQIAEKKVRPSSRDNQELPKVSRISLEGCARLKNVFLQGLPNLEELNLSETAIEALDLEAMQVRQLVRLFLIGCEKLRRVQWLNARNPPLKLLCVDTRWEAERSVANRQRSHVYSQIQDFAHVMATDARFLRGFRVFGSNFHLHLSSTVSSRQLPGSTKTRENRGSTDELDLVQIQAGSSPTYSDILDKVAQEQDIGEDRSNACTQLLPSERHIEVAKGVYNWDSKGGNENMISLMCSAQSLEVHDNCSITAANPEFKNYINFKNLRWCRINRCSNLRIAFPLGGKRMPRYAFKSLETFSASHLLRACSIWSRTLRFEYLPSWTRIRERRGFHSCLDLDQIIINKPASFSQLRHIHLHSCPRLSFVLPWSFPILARLETIQITYCGELRQIFPKGKIEKQELATNIKFPKLRNIHLHELPMLQLICETNMSAPRLETVRLRGCWSLRRLPAIHTDLPQDKPPAVVDCEKDWWDKLQWDGLEASRSLFSPQHSGYYKKTIPRGSLLR